MTLPTTTHLEQEVTLPIGAGDPHDVKATVEVDVARTVTDGFLTVRREADDPYYLVRSQAAAVSAPHTVTATTHKFDLTFQLAEAETRKIGAGWRVFGVEPHDVGGGMGHALAGKVRCATREVMSKP